MRNEIALIRTHFYNSRIENIIGLLSDYFANGVYVVCPRRVLDKLDRSAMGDPSRFVLLDESALDRMGLPRPKQWEWICGDYTFYRARAELPEANHYWLIEYDVVLNYRRASDFFLRFADDDADFLAFKYEVAGEAWPWRSRMLPLTDQVMRCFFSLIRLSAGAVDHLLERRRALRDLADIDAWPNDEAFVATTLTLDGFRCRDISDGVTTPESFSWARPHSIRELKAKGPDNLVYHPVVAGAQYLRKARQFLFRYPERFSEIADTLRSECDQNQYEMLRDWARK